jgi:hypothetical protein
VNVVHSWMRTEVSADVVASVHDAEKSLLDERRKGVREEGAEPFVNRAHLQNADAALDEHLVKDIHCRDGRDVASTEDQRDLSLGLALLIKAGLTFARTGLVQARRESDGAGDPPQKLVVPPAGRQHLDLGPAVVADADVATERRAAPG